MTVGLNVSLCLGLAVEYSYYIVLRTTPYFGAGPCLSALALAVNLVIRQECGSIGKTDREPNANQKFHGRTSREDICWFESTKYGVTN